MNVWQDLIWVKDLISVWRLSLLEIWTHHRYEEQICESLIYMFLTHRMLVEQIHH